MTNSTRFCAKRSEVRNRKQKNELNFSHRWNCFETGKVAHVFIVAEEMGRETNKNTYIFTQKGLRSKSYSIRDFVLAFFFSFLFCVSFQSVSSAKLTTNPECNTNEKEYFEMVQNRLFYNSVLLRIFSRPVACIVIVVISGLNFTFRFLFCGGGSSGNVRITNCWAFADKSVVHAQQQWARARVPLFQNALLFTLFNEPNNKQIPLFNKTLLQDWKALIQH